MQWLLALSISTALTGGAHALDADAPLRLTVTLGEPRVISVESREGWTPPGDDVVAPVPLAPARLELTIPARAHATRRARRFDTI